ncbi:MAG: helix-turn-helix domain-containing protein [Desulfobacterales bacterium]|nr:MAG: helix-turn-helix domain-containing protein [Desulfobacterales bacterium]
MTEILTRKEVAIFLRIPLGTIDYLLNTNQIPFSRIGQRSVRFEKKRLEAWLREREGIKFQRNRNSCDGK